VVEVVGAAAVVAVAVVVGVVAVGGIALAAGAAAGTGRAEVRSAGWHRADVEASAGAAGSSDRVE
jgi:hypothetical protein